jgi:hypothetical protein
VKAAGDAAGTGPGRWRVAASFLIAAHVGAMALVPNSDNHVGRSLQWLVEPYVNTLGLGTRWGFFAPDPGMATQRVEWDLIGKDGETFRSGAWLEAGAEFFFKDRQYRWTNVGFFVLSAEGRAEQILAPYLCRSDGQVRSVRIWAATRMHPHWSEVLGGKRNLAESGSAERKLLVHTFCEGGGA